MMTLDNLISVLGLCLTSVALGFALGYALGQIHAKNNRPVCKTSGYFLYLNVQGQPSIGGTISISMIAQSKAFDNRSY